MAWRCQVEPYLKRLSAQVLHCEAGEFKLKNEKLKGWKVKTDATVFFPEGGGQPGDGGKITAAGKCVNVIYTYREGEAAVHFCDEEIETGPAELEIDWERRFDHMQQHSAQHLISAIFENSEFHADTTSWNMGEEISHIELSRPVTSEEARKVENLCNTAILNGTKVSVEVISEKDPTLRGTKDLPEDFAGPIRVVNIAGIDRNMCCGTHVTNLSDVQGIKPLHVENGKKGKGIVWFVAGRRVFDVLNGSWNVQRAACAQLSCQPTQLSERIEKMSLNLRQTQKELKNLTREIADFSAQDLIRQMGDEKLIKLHRKDVGPDFLTSAAEKLKHLLAQEVTIALSCGEQKKGGNVVILGDREKIDNVSKEILSLLDGKGAAKNGRIQAKISNVKNIEKVYELLK